MANHPYLGQQLDHMFQYRPFPYGSKGAVASDSAYATRAGLEILKKNGNAFDAACAVSLVLGLVAPYHSGIGGGCFHIFYHKASHAFYSCDARGTAPMHASKDMFLDEKGNVDPSLTEFSGRSVAVPAFYRAMDQLLRAYGTMTWEEVSAPAVKLAREGFACGFPYARISDTPEAEHNKEAYEGFSELYLHDGKPRIFGEWITNPDLADTMEQVARHGVDWFYKGPIADEIVAVVQKHKGVLVKEDLVNCHPRNRTPVRGTFNGCDIISMAPPSSGGTHIIQMLNILENFDLKGMGYHSADATHVIAETMKMMFADRSVAMGDPDFVDIHLDKLLSKAYAKELAAKIDMNEAREYAPSEGIEARPYAGCTTNFSIMDACGNVFVQTQTIRNRWGCGVVVPHRGFIMNNAMADFSAKTGVQTSQGLAYGEANAVAPGKTPLSSMCPTLVFKEGNPVLAVGCAGGPRIITSVLQMIINTLVYGRMMEPAVRTPFMCCLTKKQGLELEDGFSPDTVSLLERKGHKVIQSGPLGVQSCLPNGIMKRDNLFYPAGTNRVDGGGGVLTDSGSIAIDGICFEEKGND
jgi:gamma-glutamyltranspeptidase/glutathione hydrolase